MSRPAFFIGGSGSFDLWKSLLPPQTHELPMWYATYSYSMDLAPRKHGLPIWYAIYSYSMDLAPRKRGLALVGFGGNVIDQFKVMA